MEIINHVLLEAIEGESNAEVRYKAFAEQALREGYPGVAKLFMGLSRAEAVHVGNHRRALEKNEYSGPLPQGATPDTLGTTLENISVALADELEEFKHMYPSFHRQVSKKYGSEFIAKIALLSMRWATESEKKHYLLLQQAMAKVEVTQDMDNGEFYLCLVCGNLEYSSHFPEKLCDVCGHDLTFFTKVED